MREHLEYLFIFLSLPYFALLANFPIRNFQTVSVLIQLPDNLVVFQGEMASDKVANLMRA